MPRAVVETRPNKKVTDFFPKQIKNLKARRVNEIIEISSSSDKRSVISVSSDDSVPSSSSTSLKDPNTSSKDARPLNPKQSKTTSRPVSGRSSDTQSTLSSRGTSSGPTDNRRASKPKAKRALSAISAGDSSDDDTSLPSIVLPLDNDCTNITPKARRSSRLSPFTPRQNLQSPPKNKHMSPVKISASPFHTLKDSARLSTPKAAVVKRPSPSKRPRYHSPEKKAKTVSESDADDENEFDEPPPSTSPRSSSIDGTTPMDVDGDVGELNILPVLIEPLTSFPSSIKTPPPRKNEIIPSSQHGEMEVDELEFGLPPPLEKENADKKATKSPYLAHLSGPASTLSPCSARTLAIINEIKAKAEIEAALEAQKSKSRSSLGLSSDDDSDLTSLSDGSDDLNFDLSLDLSGKGKGKVAQPPIESRAKTEDPPAQNIRRSARHQDVPAPNYKVKLSLVRSPSPPSRPTKAVAAPQKCPLDKIVKESVYLKAAAETSLQASSSRATSSRATSVDITDYGRAETPQSSSHPDYDQTDPDSPFLDQRIKVEDREAILGKDASDAIGKILQNDRKNRKEQMSVKVETFSVWDDHSMVTEEKIPGFSVKNNVSPLITSLKSAICEHNYETAALLIDSGALVWVCQSPEFFAWLFKLVFNTQSVLLSTSAYRAILSLQPEQVPAGWLTEELAHWVLQRLGFRSTVSEVLGIGTSLRTTEDDKSKINTVSSLLTMLSALSRTRALTETTIPCLTMALVTLGMDTLISSSLRLAVIATIESLLSEQSFSKQIELSTVKAIHQVIVKLDFTIDDQASLLELLSGCGSVSGRVRCWVAWSMLGGDLDVVAIKQYTDFPPFSDISNLFLKDAPGKMKMVIHSEVDYQVLGVQTDILSVVMSDIEGYMRETGGKEFVEDTYRDLDKILGKINDTRAAHLDRSKTKDTMNRLRNRLQYQLEAATHLRPRRNKLDHFFERKPKSATVVGD